MQKIVPIGERLQFELRGELFNGFNHPNQLFAAPGPQNSNNATFFGTSSFWLLSLQRKLLGRSRWRASSTSDGSQLAR
jgi:hypothetical protein